jgi:hypothetical protein
MIRAAKLAVGGAALLAALVVPALSAHAAGGDQIATISAGATALVWQPAVAYERMTLTVSGPDGVFTREFDAATLPSLDLFGADGYALADGGYTWELVVTPALSGKVRNELARARQTGDESRLADLRRTGELPEPSVVSGHFRVHEGAFVPFGADEAESAGASAGAAAGPRSITGAAVTPMADATTISGDLSVYNSLCVGFDCLAAESYGSDTIRLKENTTRIHFDDTSSTAGFPNRDWRILANDQNSGGANKFAIEDSTGGLTPFTIEAGAVNNSLYVDTGARVGIGTATPVLNVHVNSSNTPAVRLEQNSSGGFTAQTWDLAGNEASFFIRDVTSGSRLPFRIQPGAASNSLTIEDDSDVGVGTLSPSKQLHVTRSNGTTGVLVQETSATLDNNRVLMEIVNNGRAQFRLRNTAEAAGLSWFVSAETGGNFGISREGTGALEVQVTPTGNMIITGNYTPDYVFEPDYPLMPIGELAEFIERERHLPNVPNAAEIAENGIVVNDFPMALLEKIEELTLYTIEQQRTIETLQTEVRELKESAAN